MTNEVNQNLDDMVTFETDQQWARENLPFEVGKSTLVERLEALQAFFGGQAKMSEAGGMSVSAIKSWLRGTEPGMLKIVHLAQQADVSMEYLAFGTVRERNDLELENARFELARAKAMHGAGAHRRASLVARAAEIEKHIGQAVSGFVASARDLSALAASQDNVVQIPRFEVRAAAGSGAVALTESVSSYFAVEREWLRRSLPAWAGNNAEVGILEGSGDSMEPTIRDGDLIMAVRDPPEYVVDRGGVFLILHHGHLRIKRLQVDMRSGDIALISDNTRYAPEIVEKQRLEYDLQILAQIFFAGGRLRS